MRRVICLLAACFIVCTAPVHAQTASEVSLVKELFTELQSPSITNNREYCGLIGIDEDGILMATEPRRGRRASCRPRNEPAGMRVTASYHTHAAFRRAYDNEVPSPADVEGDMAEGINGFVATPGGRLWFIDGTTGISSLICGPGCLPRDARYQPDPDDPIADRYTLGELRRRTGAER